MDTLNILICVGLQNDLLTGNHATSQSSDILNNVVSKINNFKGIVLGITIYNLENSYENTLEYKYDDVIYCKQFEHGYEKPEEINNALKNSIYLGESETYLMTSQDIVYKIQQIAVYHQLDYKFHVIGLNTDTRVINTALMLRQNFGNSEIYIDASCCAGTSPELHDAALLVAKSNFIHVLNHPTINDIQEV